MEKVNVQTPWLTLPLNKEDDEVSSNGSRLYNLKENKVYEIKFLTEEFGKSQCIGSSHGWLFLMDDKANPYLLNVFACKSMQLPVIESFPMPWIQRVEDGFIVQHGKYCMEFCGCFGLKTVERVQETFLVKAILSCDPLENKTWFVFSIFGEDKKLAYCGSNHDMNCWAVIENAFCHAYCDIICKGGDVLYGLGDGSVEGWKIKDSKLEKVVDVNIAYPEKSWETATCLKDICSTNSYIVESCGDILLVVRFIGDFVNGEGRPMRQEDLLTDEDSDSIVCPYRTLSFQIYKLNFASNEWVELKDLGDRALFLGGNHSFSVSTMKHPECNKNSIYFSDDYWDRVDEDNLYGGHDIGEYNLEDESIVSYSFGDRQKMLPVPIWVYKY